MAQTVKNSGDRAIVPARPVYLYHPAYWAQACADLARCDPVLKTMIPGIEGSIQLSTQSESFVSLARAIVGQQISVKAAQTIWERIGKKLQHSVLSFKPHAILHISDMLLVECGLSQRKIAYLKDLARYFEFNLLKIAAWPQMDNQEVRADLMRVRGVGKWTVDMFLIFNLHRSDILPLEDIGLMRAVSRHYFSGAKITRKEVQAVAENWHPWYSVATWYMWRSLDVVAVQY